MKRYALLLILVLALVGLAGCDRMPGETDESLPPVTTPTEGLLLPTPITDATAAATTVFATAEALATAAPSATTEPPTDEPATAALSCPVTA